MPGKYSHSVVLAEQSSRGLISLSNDQYLAYLKSSPLITTKPRPHRASTAPPRNRERATSIKTNGSERLVVQKSLRQQISSDQLAIGAYRHQSSNVHRTTRHVIVDSDEDVSGEYSDIESQRSRPSYGAYSTKSQRTSLRQKRVPHKLSIDLHQQVVQDGLLSSNLHGTQRAQSRNHQPAAKVAPDVRESIDLPIQIPYYHNGLPARSRASSFSAHNRDISNPKSLSIPQLSRSSTEWTHQDDFPATPFSSLQRGTTSAMTHEQRPNSSRQDSALTQDTRIFRPGPAKMPSQVSFDGLFDDSEQGAGYFKDLPESAEGRKARMMNLPAYNAMEKAINDSPGSATFGPEKNLQAEPNSDSTLSPPPQNRYEARRSSPRSLSSLSDFAIGVPSVSQTTSQPNSSAAAMKSTNRRSIYGLGISTPQNPPQISASSKRRPSTLPSPPPEFDPTTTTTLLHFLNSLDSRFSDPEPDGESESGAASPPPDIARHPPAMLDPPAQLIVDSRGGVTSLAAQGQEKQRQRSKSKGGGLMSSFRFKGKKSRGEVMPFE